MKLVKNRKPRNTRISAFILRWAGTLSLVGTALAFVGAYYSVQLYKNLKTDFRELLPTTSRSVLDLNEVSDRLESIDNLAILIFSKDPEASRRFVTDLAHALDKAPKSVISSVEFEISRELKFFKNRESLYIDSRDLTHIRDYIKKRINYETQLYNPLVIFEETDLPEPKLDFLALRQKYNQKTSRYERFPDGYYATPDGTKRVILAYMPGGSATGIDGGHKLKDFVEKSIKELNPASYSPDIEIKYTGGIQDAIEENAALIADLELSTVIVTVLVTFAMFFFYRSVRATLALMGSLFMGTFWTFGVSYFAVGYLNANSAFLGSIVIGNGINFGIIFLARYLEERRRGNFNTRAIHAAITRTATSTLAAALAAGLAYGSLILTSFRGFRQFGVIGLIGMVLCWVSSYTLLPAYLTVLDRMRSLEPRGNPPKSYLMTAIASLISRAPRAVWIATLCVTALSLAALTRYTPKILETDLSKLRNKESLEHGSAYLSRYLDEIFQHYLSPLVILPKTREHAREIAEILKTQKEAEGPHSLIAAIQTLDDFVPNQQEEKIRLLHEIQGLLPPKIFYRLSPDDQRKARELLRTEGLHPLKESDLPALVLSKFTEKDQSIGKLVLVEPPLTKETWDGDNLLHFIHSLRNAADKVEPGTAVAGTLTITADMIESIAHDGPRATLFAFLAVVVLVILLFRNFHTISLCLFALFLGVLWLAGIILGFGIKINFLNFIALPITFGIGVDYGVNIFQRYKEEGGKNILKVIKNTGGAVALCSFTTITGYTSLLIAGNQGFVSFGVLAVAGEITCVTAAIIALPAFLLSRKKKI